MSSEFDDTLMPYGAELNALRTMIHGGNQKKHPSHYMSDAMRSLYWLFQMQNPLNQNETDFCDDVLTFFDFVDELMSAEPRQTDLQIAPHLDRWCGCRIQSEPRLLGIVSSHPRLRERARIYTSPFLRVAADRSWARTLSRFYRLQQYDPTFLQELQFDGVISISAEPIPF